VVGCILPTTWRSSDVGPAAGWLPHFRMFTARAKTSSVVDGATATCRAINDFAYRDSSIVSVGEKTMTFVELV
jgi:hypothetical protein